MLTRRSFAALPFAAGAAALAGCKKDPFKPGYNVIVEMNSTLFSAKNEPASLEVHVIMLPEALAMKLEKFPMSEYWNPSAPDNNYAKYKMFFGPGKPTSQTLDSTDPIWRKWQQGMPAMEHHWIFILADLKGAFTDKESSKDPRRMILPANPKAWLAGRTIQISIGRDGMVNLSPRAQQ